MGHSEEKEINRGTSLQMTARQERAHKEWKAKKGPF